MTPKHATLAFALGLVLALGSSITWSAPGPQPPRTPPPPPPPSTAQALVHRVYLDLDGGGIDLSRCQVSAKHRTLASTGADRMLAIDIAAANAAGFRVAASTGATARVVPFGNGLRITLPNGATYDPVDGWTLLALIETTRDGVLDKRDLIWPALRLTRDDNGNGLIDDEEVSPLSGRGIAVIGARAPVTTERDPSGNELAHGAFVRNDGTAGRMADAALARCE